MGTFAYTKSVTLSQKRYMEDLFSYKPLSYKCLGPYTNYHFIRFISLSNQHLNITICKYFVSD